MDRGILWIRTTREHQINVALKEERDLFFKRLDEMGAEGQWGIFAMAIPGRVGYQVKSYPFYFLNA